MKPTEKRTTGGASAVCPVCKANDGKTVKIGMSHSRFCGVEFDVTISDDDAQRTYYIDDLSFYICPHCRAVFAGEIFPVFW